MNCDSIRSPALWGEARSNVIYKTPESSRGVKREDCGVKEHDSELYRGVKRQVQLIESTNFLIVSALNPTVDDAGSEMEEEA